ncbi:hypothetical protein L2E82_44899 [Cichorium intybus]|uniref:Uncharacterized protein n=1 Tax=Cichorium intybus TaxID=13427 RepID=A0ACB8ZR35_CICIN|nr:hypothetical protein L2E82_44899 [Cichorium intybus]
MQRLAQEHVKRVLDEQEKFNADLDKRRKKLDSWSKELNKREALTKCEKQKLDEEKRKNDLQNNSLQMAYIEQKKADESVLRLVEEQKREKEEALKKLLELERQLDAKQKLEMEIEELKGKLQVMKHLGDEDGAAVQEKIKEMNNELQAKMEEMDNGLQDILNGRTNIGVKRMGEIDMKAFHDACKEKFEYEEAQVKASELRTFSWKMYKYIG